MLVSPEMPAALQEPSGKRQIYMGERAGIALGQNIVTIYKSYIFLLLLTRIEDSGIGLPMLFDRRSNQQIPKLTVIVRLPH
jgi:hypothetical protein